MLKFLSDDALWKELRRISKNRKRRLCVAVPYVGSDTSKLLHLRRGDVLVVALTEANARNGSVCPAEIGRFQRRGVNVFLAADLHAKVMLCGGKAVVGSANLSQSSFKYRDEAAIVTTDATVVRNVRDWFDQRMLEPVTPEWLGTCAEVYRPPRADMTRLGVVKRRKRHNMGRSVWRSGCVPQSSPKPNLRCRSEGRLKHPNGSRTRKDTRSLLLRFVGCKRLVENIRRGDSWIPVWTDGASHYVEEHGRVISWERVRKAGKLVTYFFVESPRRPKKVGWGMFKQECRSAGIKLGERRRISGDRESTASC